MHFYYGIWAAGILGCLSVLMVTFCYRITRRDIKRLPQAKGKWLQNLYRDYTAARNENSQINNFAVFVETRVNGRKIGHISIHRIRECVWYAFVLCFAFLGAEYAAGYKAGMTDLNSLLLQPKLLLTGLGVPLALLAIDRLCQPVYQEKLLKDQLLDYLENRQPVAAVKIPLPVISPQVTEAAAQTAATLTPVRAARANPVVKPAKMPRKPRGSKTAVKPVTVIQTPDMDNELKADQITRAIQETAAAGGKYSHVLSKEEEDIVKDVIKQFLA